MMSIVIVCLLVFIGFFLRAIWAENEEIRKVRLAALFITMVMVGMVTGVLSVVSFGGR
jgi:hypothetical protein